MTRFRARQLVGKYRIQAKLAEGGSAVVYRAFDQVEGVPVALKVPLAQYQGEDALADFRREARVLAKLDHPNILPIKNATLVNGKLIIAYALGEESLADRLTRRLSVRRAVGYTRQMLRGVAWAHAHRVVHMDIKPENFVLFRDGRLRLTDFGIAHIVWKTRALDTLAGTPGYMAPEQAMGRPSSRSDVFSLGLVIYRMLTGALPEWPFDWPPPRLNRLQQALPVAFERFLRKALQPDARVRFADAGEMLDAFEQMEPVLRRDVDRGAQPQDGACNFCRARPQS